MDPIDRQAAIDEVVNWLKDRMTDVKNGKPLTDRLKDLPSAQPDVPDTNVGDMVSKQAVIDAIVTWTIEDRPDIEMPTDLVGRINALPSAQPEPKCANGCIYGWGSTECEHCALKSAQPEVLAHGEGELSAQPEPQWIPCERELPKVGRSVLISVGGMYTAEGCLREDGDWTQFRWDAIQRKDIVGAWKPLDEPWKGEQNE